MSARAANGVWAVFWLTMALAGGYVYKLHTQRDPALERPIDVIREAQEIYDHLERFESQLGAAILPYSNHCHRVMTFALHMLGPADEATTTYRRRLLGPALAYHDIGLWSDQDLDYLDPSMARAKEDLPGLGYSEDEIKVILDMIHWHHKLSPFTDNTTTIKDHVALVESFRRADSIDFTLGFVSMGMPQKHIIKVQKALPNSGFHLALLKLPFAMHQFNFPRHLEILRIFKA